MVLFKSLRLDEIEEIVGLLLQDLRRRLAGRWVKLELSDAGGSGNAGSKLGQFRRFGLVRAGANGPFEGDSAARRYR